MISLKNSVAVSCLPFLLVLSLLLCLFWPNYRATTLAGISAISRPFLKAANLSSVKKTSYRKSKLKDAYPQKLAEEARSMEFRIQQYRIDQATIRSWCQEWECGPEEKLLLIRLLLRQLPEAGAKETSSTQKNDLIQSILDLTTEGRRNQPNNAFFWISEAITLFYSGQDEAAWLLLKQAQSCSQMNGGLKALNQSEYALWKSDSKVSRILPVTPRNWGLDLERPLQTLSRGLNIQQRGSLQKYNIERGVELSLIHLNLATRIADAGWVPSDQAIATGMMRRSLEPFWTDRNSEPTDAQLQQNFLKFLDDQGDKISISKARVWFASINHQEEVKKTRLEMWRKLQILSAWSPSSTLGSLMLETTSLLIVLFTLIFFMKSSWLKELHQASNLRSIFPNIAFVLAPISWAVLNWTAGGTLLVFGLLGTWMLWMFFAKISLKDMYLESMTACLFKGGIVLVSLTIALTSGIAALLQYRQECFKIILEQGWLR
jgi:hypothetical protein